jgi:hypothetical protein
MKELKNNMNIDTFKEVKLYKSTEFHKFKLLEYNRDINKAHVEKLKNELSQRNDLHLKPLIMTPDLEIIDGQHRFTAAQEMKIPIYYLIDYEFTPEKLIMHNTLQKNWSVQDSFRFFVEQGNDNYFLFKQLLDKYPMTIDSLLLFTHGKASRGDVMRQFKTGKYKYLLTPMAFRCLEAWKDIKTTFENKQCRSKNALLNKVFINAIINFFGYREIDVVRFLDRLNTKPFSFTAYASVYDYVLWLSDVYNFGGRKGGNVKVFRNGTKTELIFK